MIDIEYTFSLIYYLNIPQAEKEILAKDAYRQIYMELIYHKILAQMNVGAIYLAIPLKTFFKKRTVRRRRLKHDSWNTI